MIELPATFTKSNPPRWELVDLEKLQWFTGHPLFITHAYPVIRNAPMNPTITSQFKVIQPITKFDGYLLGAEDNPGYGIYLVFHINLSSSREATTTHIHTLNSLSNPFYKASDLPEVQLISELVALSESSRLPSQVKREKEEQETIYADTNQASSFKDLVSALDRISRPTEIEDIPLPFDPDDYPVV